MSIPKYIDLNNFQPTGDSGKDLKTLATMIQKEFDYLHSKITQGKTGTFNSLNTPSKVVTVTNGIITDIQ